MHINCDSVNVSDAVQIIILIIYIIINLLLYRVKYFIICDKILYIQKKENTNVCQRIQFYYFILATYSTSTGVILVYEKSL